MNRKRFAALLLALLMLAASACAEGILPVLQTPPPEITETISYHRVMNLSSTPSASSASDGSFFYTYSSIRYADYLAFGRALAQEGFALAESGFTDSGLPQLVVEKDGCALTVEYNPYFKEMTVRYPPRVLAWEVDVDHPYTIDDSLESALPDLPRTLSYHRALNQTYPPSGERYGDGRWYFSYSSVDYDHYLKFGRALAQEGYAATGSEVDGDAVETVTLSDGNTALELTYSPFTHSLRVIYPIGTLPAEVDLENRYAVDPATPSALPELKQTISMHSATGKGFPSPERVTDGYRYYYSSVPYAAYAQFSVKLAEEGFTLVSSEKTEDGYDRAVVSDGDVTLTLDYSQEGEFAMVTYPLDVSPRNARKYDDYTIVGAGDTVELSENLTANVLGWQAMDQYVTYYYDDNWIPVAKYIDHEHTSGDGVQQMLVTFQITNERPDTLDARSLLNGLTVYCDGESVSCDYGTMSGETHFSTDSDQVLRPKETITFAVGFALTDEHAAHPENVAVTFTDKNYAVRYAYILAP